MATKDLTIKIRTSLSMTDVWAGLDLIADNADNITVEVVAVKRTYKKKKPRQKAARYPELVYERGPWASHSSDGERYDRINIYASCRKNDVALDELMATDTKRGSWQNSLKHAASLRMKGNGGHDPECIDEEQTLL
jgi:hypothetical protein